MSAFGPVLDAAGRALDQVSVRGLRARGRHGVLGHERVLGQRFAVDVVLHLDTRAAASGDDLTRTVDYADLAERAVRIVAGEPVALLETLAQLIADVALGYPGVVAADVEVHKPQAPLGVAFDDVAVSIRRWRE